MFNDDFFSNLPKDPANAAFSLVVQFKKFADQCTRDNTSLENYEKYLEAAALCHAFIGILEVSVPKLSLTSDHSQNIANIMQFFNHASKAFSEKKIDFLSIQARDKLQSQFESLLIYKFTDGDLSRIQGIINELRDMITGSDYFSENHKERLLKRLEEMQLELHKKMSSVDKFWGFIMDAGPALGKFGSDAKPFFDRINELSQIVWRTQSITQELPSATPLPLLFQDKVEEK